MDFVSVMLNKGLAVDIRNQPQILPDPNSQKYITSLEVVPGNSGNLANGYCIVPATQCILVGLKQLPADVTVGFTAGIKINGSPATPEDLAPVPPPGGGGTRIAFVLGNLGSEGQVVGEYATASQLVFNANTSQDTAGSLTPVPTVQPMLVNSTGVPPTTSLPARRLSTTSGSWSAQTRHKPAVWTAHARKAVSLRHRMGQPAPDA
jgi:hypothetical protein